MAQLPGAFDATTVDTTDNFDVLPAGDYKVQIVQSELRVTKAGTGQYIWLELDVLDGQFTGRKIWDNVNIINPNQQAQQIGEKILAQICQACGITQATDSEQFHFKPMIAKVKVQPAKGDYDASNQVKAYRPADGGGIQPQQPAAAPQQQAQPMAQPVAAEQQPVVPAAAQPAPNAGMPWDKTITG